MILRLLIIALGLAASLWGAASTAQTLVLVSIDGFRWDYLDWPQATNMRSIAAQGSRVTKLRTVYPSKTFPGHLSIATGLHPTQHGVIDNYFCRSDRSDCYSMGKGRKDPSWLAGIPLWTLVEQQGGRASTFFWPESDAPFANKLPTDYRAFDGRVPHRERVQQVVDWLSLPADQRPDLVTLYFSVVDSASHTYGPTAPPTLSAIVEVDRQIAVLWLAIESLNLREGTDINLMLVSDHGMSEVDPNLFIDTNTLPRPKGFKRVNGTTRVTYYQRDPDADIDALSGALDRLSQDRWRRLSSRDLAERHFEHHPGVAQAGAAIGLGVIGPRYWRDELPELQAFPLGVETKQVLKDRSTCSGEAQHKHRALDGLGRDLGVAGQKGLQLQAVAYCSNEALTHDDSCVRASFEQ